MSLIIASVCLATILFAAAVFERLRKSQLQIDVVGVPEHSDLREDAPASPTVDSSIQEENMSTKKRAYQPFMDVDLRSKVFGRLAIVSPTEAGANEQLVESIKLYMQVTNADLAAVQSDRSGAESMRFVKELSALFMHLSTTNALPQKQRLVKR